MLDIHGRDAAAQRNNSSIEFLRVQFSPARGGGLFVAVTATTVDEPEPECFELVELELASDELPTIDDALALVGIHARQALASATGRA